MPPKKSRKKKKSAKRADKFQIVTNGDLIKELSKYPKKALVVTNPFYAFRPNVSFMEIDNQILIN